jgi:hypothetical protein
MADQEEPLYVDRNGVPHFARKITRLISPYLHIEGHNGSNLRADINEMLEDGNLQERDIRILNHILRCCCRIDQTQPDGLVVSMSGRQFSAFIGIRRRFIDDRMTRQFAALRNFKPTSSKVDHKP